MLFLGKDNHLEANMKLHINGHPNQNTHSGWNCGRFRVRHNQIIAGLKKVLDEKGVDYTVQNLSTSLTSPWYNQYNAPYNNVLDGHDIIVLNDKISWAKDKCYSIYFHVKNAAATKVTYNGRAGLVACVGDEILVRNFKGFCPGKKLINENENRVGDHSQLYAFVDEDENNEIDIESLVDKIIEKKAKYEEEAKKNLKATFANDMLFTMVKAMVVEGLNGIDNTFGGKGITKSTEENDYSASWKTDGNNYYNTFCVKLIKSSDHTQVNIKTRMDYSNNSETEFNVNRDNSQEARPYIANLFKTLKELYGTRLTFRYNPDASNS